MYLFVLPAIGWRHELRSERPSIIIVIIIIVMPALSSTEPRSLCIDPYVNTLYCLKIYKHNIYTVLRLYCISEQL